MDLIHPPSVLPATPLLLLSRRRSCTFKCLHTFSAGHPLVLSSNSPLCRYAPPVPCLCDIGIWFISPLSHCPVSFYSLASPLDFTQYFCAVRFHSTLCAHVTTVFFSLSPLGVVQRARTVCIMYCTQHRKDMMNSSKTERWPLSMELARTWKHAISWLAPRSRRNVVHLPHLHCGTETQNVCCLAVAHLRRSMKFSVSPTTRSRVLATEHSPTG